MGSLEPQGTNVHHILLDLDAMLLQTTTCTVRHTAKHAGSSPVLAPGQHFWDLHRRSEQQVIWNGFAVNTGSRLAAELAFARRHSPALGNSHSAQ